jgi:hypothetical protein
MSGYQEYCNLQALVLSHAYFHMSFYIQRNVKNSDLCLDGSISWNLSYVYMLTSIHVYVLLKMACKYDAGRLGSWFAHIDIDLGRQVDVEVCDLDPGNRSVYGARDRAASMPTCRAKSAHKARFMACAPSGGGAPPQKGIPIPVIKLTARKWTCRSLRAWAVWRGLVPRFGVAGS